MVDGLRTGSAKLLWHCQSYVGVLPRLSITQADAVNNESHQRELADTPLDKLKSLNYNP